MGGFFITNDQQASVQETALDVFAQKGMTQYTEFQFGQYRLLYFSKLMMQRASHIYRQQEDVIIGVGTFFYKGLWGDEALKSIYQDYPENPGLFNEVFGHFNFILFINQTLTLITDKTGSYHSYMAQENGSTYISTSLLAVAQNLTHVTPNRQEILEFVHVEACLGGKSFFKEINHVQFGMAVTLDKTLSYTHYFVEKIWDETTVASLSHYIEEQLAFLKNLDLKMTMEMTAGYDSRLACAVLKRVGCDYVMNTNYSFDTDEDVALARLIAKKEGRQWKMVNRDTPLSLEALIRKGIYSIELARNLFRAAYTPLLCEQKAKIGELIIGGYGGELYRDVKARRYKTLDRLLESQYAKSLISEGSEEYLETLKQKFLGREDIGPDTPMFEFCERVYYFEKMQYWGGSHITLYNQYTYSYHPLLDYLLLHPLFNVPPEEKHDAKFQMQMIEALDPRLASYPSAYGFNFLWNDGKPKEIAKITANKKKAANSFWAKLKQHFFPQKPELPPYLQPALVAQFIDVSQPSIQPPIEPNSDHQRGRLYTVELIYQLIQNHQQNRLTKDASLL